MRSLRFLLSFAAVVAVIFALVSPAGASTVPEPPGPPSTGATSGGLSASATNPHPAMALAYNVWNVNPANGFDNLYVDATVFRSPTLVGYFYSRQFAIKNGFHGYGGLQTRLEDCNGNNLGKGVVFSIFEAPGGATPSTPGEFQCNGAENGETFVSLRIRFDWIPGHQYEYHFFSATGHYIEMSIVDRTTGVQVLNMGTIATQSWWLGFDWGQNDAHPPVSFTENYTTSGNCNTDPGSVRWTKPMMSIGAINPTYFAPSLDTDQIQPDTGCTNSAVINTSGSLPTTGDPYNDRQKYEIVGQTACC